MLCIAGYMLVGGLLGYAYSEWKWGRLRRTILNAMVATIKEVHHIELDPAGMKITLDDE